MVTAMFVNAVALHVVIVTLGVLALALVLVVLVITCLPSPMTQRLYNRFIKSRK